MKLLEKVLCVLILVNIGANIVMPNWPAALGWLTAFMFFLRCYLLEVENG